MLITLAAFLFVLGIVIFFHELGHLVVAKLFGVSVQVFSFGFGKRLFGINISGTDCRVSLVPLGGYVQLEGENPQEVASDPRAFSKIPRWQRFLVYLAGPTMNFILAIGILTGIFMRPHQVPTGITVRSVAENSPAQKAGIQVNDRILSLDGRPTVTFGNFFGELQFKKETPFQLKVSRIDGEKVLLITPNFNSESGIYTIGVTLNEEFRTEQLGLFAACKTAALGVKDMTTFISRFTKGMAEGKVSPKTLSGPVGIAKASGQAARMGFTSLIFMAAVISLNIGILNFFPLAPLDGGWLFILLIESVIRKDLSKEAKSKIALIGSFSLLFLMLYGFHNDLAPYIKPLFSRIFGN